MRKHRQNPYIISKYKNAVEKKKNNVIRIVALLTWLVKE